MLVGIGPDLRAYATFACLIELSLYQQSVFEPWLSVSNLGKCAVKGNDRILTEIVGGYVCPVQIARHQRNLLLVFGVHLDINIIAHESALAADRELHSAQKFSANRVGCQGGIGWNKIQPIL